MVELLDLVGFDFRSLGFNTCYGFGDVCVMVLLSVQLWLLSLVLYIQFTVLLGFGLDWMLL